jgi:hypothetical protein
VTSAHRLHGAFCSICGQKAPRRRRARGEVGTVGAGCAARSAPNARRGRRGARSKALGPPVGDPSALELVAPWRLPDRRARPPRPDAGGRVSGPLRRAMGYRRRADLGPRRDRSWSASAGVTTEWPAVRVHARGGGGGHPAGFPRGSLCLAQRRELRGRLHSLAHQLAERALLRAAGGRRGEHVFGRLRMASDGTRTLRGSVPQLPRIWLCAARSTPASCKRSCTGLRGRRGTTRVVIGRREPRIRWRQ